MRHYMDNNLNQLLHSIQLCMGNLAMDLCFLHIRHIPIHQYMLRMGKHTHHKCNHLLGIILLGMDILVVISLLNNDKYHILRVQ